jgi:hypothetical protein
MLFKFALIICSFSGHKFIPFVVSGLLKVLTLLLPHQENKVLELCFCVEFLY